jgi:predicted Rossmann-fold nucleotide-binding protein
VAVIGAGGAQEGSEAWTLAEGVGRRLAEAGVALVCGGGGGVMEAASRALPSAEEDSSTAAGEACCTSVASTSALGVTR